MRCDGLAPAAAIGGVAETRRCGASVRRMDKRRVDRLHDGRAARPKYVGTNLKWWNAWQDRATSRHHPQAESSNVARAYPRECDGSTTLRAGAPLAKAFLSDSPLHARLGARDAAGRFRNAR